MKNKLLALGALAGLALSATVVTAAYADPNGTPTYRTLAGVGSDTTQDVVNGLSDVIVDGSGTKLVGSYDAFGSSTIQTKAGANCAGIARPAGSGAGRTALLKSLNPSDPTFGCLDFSRSSSLNLTQASTQLTYIPFATDAVTYAVASGSTIPKNLSKTDLKAIYTCQISGYSPLLPQAGSGTRAFWIAQLGLTEQTIGTCVKDTKNGVSIQEHDGRVLTNPDEIVPISVAQFIAQSFGIIQDKRGGAQLGSIDGVPPIALNTNFGVKRSVYDVIPTSKVSDPTYSSVFVGPTSQVCSHADVIQKYGFGTAADCGSTTNQTP